MIKKKIVHVASSFLPRLGGIPCYIRDFCQNLPEYDHHIFVRDLWKCKGESIARAPIGTADVGYAKVHRFFQPLPAKILGFGDSSIISNDLLKGVKEFDFDLLIVHTTLPDLVEVAKVTSQPWLLMARFSLKWLTDYAIKHAHKIIFFKDSLVRETTDCTSDRVEFLYPAVNTDWFRPPPKVSSDTLLWTGRIAPEKGIIQFMPFFKKVIKSQPNMRLRIVGTADHPQMMRDLEEAIAVQGVGLNVDLVGELHGKALRMEYKKAGLFLVLSDRETWCISAQEALSSGLIVLTRPDLPWFVPAVTRVSKLSDFPKAILKHVGKANTLGRKLVLEKYSWDVLKPKYVKVLEEAMAK